MWRRQTDPRGCFRKICCWSKPQGYKQKTDRNSAAARIPGHIALSLRFVCISWNSTVKNYRLVPLTRCILDVHLGFKKATSQSHCSPFEGGTFGPALFLLPLYVASVLARVAIGPNSISIRPDRSIAIRWQVCRLNFTAIRWCRAACIRRRNSTGRVVRTRWLPLTTRYSGQRYRSPVKARHVRLCLVSQGEPRVLEHQEA